jgi:putative nucleotidyltransferase with HDIG domain
MDPLMECLQTADKSLPMLPSTAMRVVELAADPDVNVGQLARIVMKDQILASRLLTLANSAYAAPRQPVTTLTQAMVRLGTGTVRNLVLTVSLYSRLCDEKTYGPSAREIMDHGIGTAYLARLVAEVARVDVDEAFLCGLVHDIGKLLIYKTAHDHKGVFPSDPRDLAELVEQKHAEVGARALRSWHLPESLEQPVMHHHDYQGARTARRQTAVIYLANRLSHRYGFGCAKEEFDPLADPVCEQLNIDQAWLADTDVHAPGLFEIARQSLQ